MPGDLWCTGFLREGLPAFFVIASAPIGARGAGAVERGVAEACFQQPWTHKGSSVRDTEAERGRPEVEAAPHRNTRNMSHAAAGYTRHGGAPVPKAGPFYRYSATFLGATMWFWLFYRAKHDWKQWVGIEHPWDHAH